MRIEPGARSVGLHAEKESRKIRVGGKKTKEAEGAGAVGEPVGTESAFQPARDEVGEFVRGDGPGGRERRGWQAGFRLEKALELRHAGEGRRGRVGLVMVHVVEARSRHDGTGEEEGEGVRSLHEAMTR